VPNFTTSVMKYSAIRQPEAGEFLTLGDRRLRGRLTTLLLVASGVCCTAAFPHVGMYVSGTMAV
jgi:hypothetical protein